MQNLSILDGSPPIFENPLPVGQLYFPKWDKYEAAMRGIFERQYYNNNGPLVQRLEAQLRDFFGVKHVICIGNATFGLMMVAEALELKGRVLMPSFTFIASAQSLQWCGLKPAFCDIDPENHQLDPMKTSKILDTVADISAIMAVNLWGGACDVEALKEIADANNVPLYFDSAHAFGGQVDNKHIANFGSAEVFSFHATKVLSAAEGGCVTTNDDELAAKLRGICPSYGKEKFIEPRRVLNSRMSEAQAAIALLSLEEYSKIQKRNKMLFEVYSEGLSKIRGIKLILPSNVTVSNYQYAVCEIETAGFGMSRDSLLKVLMAENVFARRYFHPSTHRSSGFDQDLDYVANSLPVTERLCDKCLQLPLGSKITVADAETICSLIIQSQEQAENIRHKLREVN